MAAAVDGKGYSPALATFLDDDEAQGDDDGDKSVDLELDNLDITSTDVSLKGLDADLERYAGHEVVHAVLDQGCDPREFRAQYEARLQAAELASIQDYIAESNNLVLLHEQISACDRILADMEGMLGRFQGDLGAISGEIRSLQEQSQSMSVRLRNRKAAEAKLGAFLEGLIISPALVEGILHAEPDAGFQEHLLALHKKLEFAERSDAAHGSEAWRDVAPNLERLRAKAAAKAHDLLMARIYALRKPKTNIQILQQNVLLKLRFLVSFLRRHARDVLAEVRAAYAETLSRVLSSHFRAYLAALERLHEDVAGPHDLLGEAVHGGVGSVMAGLFVRGGAGGGRAGDSGVGGTGARTAPFALGERAAILHHLDQPALIPHVWEAQRRKAPFEVLFRSVAKLLLDTATSEFLFCCDFFQDDALFRELFAATLSIVEASMAAAIQETHDLVGLLLMIRINYHHQLIMNKRRIPALDAHLDRVNLLLWPRFKALLDLQLASVRGYNAANFNLSTDANPVVQRYAELTTSLLLLNADYQDGQLDHNIDRLRFAALDLLQRLARRFDGPRKRQATIFLIANLTHVASMLREAAARGGAMAHVTGALGTTPPPPAAPLGASGAETLKEFEDMLATATSTYVEEEVAGVVGPLVTFVKAAEAAARAQGTPEGRPVAGYGPIEAAPILADFAARWTSAIEALNKAAARDFGPAQCGREALRAALTQLLLYYTRLLEHLKRAGPGGAALVRDAVTVPSIMYEIKRYNRP